MKIALGFKDEKSDKFWRFDTFEKDMMVNWGKIGTAGRYEIRNFDSKDECENQAEKLVISKKKKGYQEIDFDENNHLYFDDEEWGLDKLTSHPIFRKYCDNEWFYDCMDEEAPFGSDVGSDTFHTLEQKIKKSKINAFVELPKLVIEKDWDMEYLPPSTEQTVDVIKAMMNDDKVRLLYMNDSIILAITFGQFKIMGQIDNDLLLLALQSLERRKILDRLSMNWEETKVSYAVEFMEKSLKNYQNR